MKTQNKPSVKEAINHAYDLIYKLNDMLPEPLDNPFELIDDLEKETVLLSFVDCER